MGLIYNERVKLFAAALSNTGVAIVITGVIGPVAALLNGSPGSVAGTW